MKPSPPAAPWLPSRRPQGGFGFIQFFLHPYRSCAQSTQARLAETISVTERGYQQKFLTGLGTPSETDTIP